MTIVDAATATVEAPAKLSIDAMNAAGNKLSDFFDEALDRDDMAPLAYQLNQLNTPFIFGFDADCVTVEANPDALMTPAEFQETFRAITTKVNERSKLAPVQTHLALESALSAACEVDGVEKPQSILVGA